MVDSLCAIASVVRPAMSTSSASRMMRSVSVSTLDVASSRIRIAGSNASAPLDRLVRDRRIAEPDVSGHRSREQMDVLKHEAELFAQRLQLHGPDIRAID